MASSLAKPLAELISQYSARKNPAFVAQQQSAIADRAMEAIRMDQALKAGELARKRQEQLDKQTDQAMELKRSVFQQAYKEKSKLGPLGAGVLIDPSMSTEQLIAAHNKMQEIAAADVKKKESEKPLNELRSDLEKSLKGPSVTFQPVHFDGSMDQSLDAETADKQEGGWAYRGLGPSLAGDYSNALESTSPANLGELLKSIRAKASSFRTPNKVEREVFTADGGYRGKETTFETPPRPDEPISPSQMLYGDIQNTGQSVPPPSSVSTPGATVPPVAKADENLIKLWRMWKDSHAYARKAKLTPPLPDPRLVNTTDPEPGYVGNAANVHRTEAGKAEDQANKSKQDKTADTIRYKYNQVSETIPVPVGTAAAATAWNDKVKAINDVFAMVGKDPKGKYYNAITEQERAKLGNLLEIAKAKKVAADKAVIAEAEAKKNKPKVKSPEDVKKEVARIRREFNNGRDEVEALIATATANTTKELAKIKALADAELLLKKLRRTYIEDAINGPVIKKLGGGLADLKAKLEAAKKNKGSSATKKKIDFDAEGMPD